MALPKIVRYFWPILVLAPFALGWVLLTHKSAQSLERTLYLPPKPVRSWSDWDEVFASAPLVRHVALDTGAVHVLRRKNLSQSHPLTASYQDGSPLRVFAHLIRHPRQGDVLIDSGLDASFATAPYGNIAAPARYLLDALMDAPYSQVPGTDIAASLTKHNAGPHTVFFTHLHMDHTAGIPALKSDIKLVTGPSEADDWVGWFGFGHLRTDQLWTELDFSKAVDMPPLGPCIDLFGDGSLWAVSTPGHSQGHVSYLAVDALGPILLTGDASHFNWAFEKNVGPDGTDPAQAQTSLERLRSFALRYPSVRIHTGHEAMKPASVSPKRSP